MSDDHEIFFGGPPVLESEVNGAEKEKDPFADNKDKLGFAGEDYARAVAQVNEEMNNFSGDRVRESLHQFLIQFGEPKGYQGLYVAVRECADALVLYLMTAGYIAVTPMGMASAENREKTYEDRKSKAKELMGWDKPQPPEPVGPARFKPGAYL